MKFWDEVLLPSFKSILSNIFAILPNILAALTILFVGWIVAKLFEKLVKRILEKFGFNGVVERSGIVSFLKKSGINREVSWILGKIIFWLLFLVFMLASAEALQLRALANILSQLVSFIPNIIAVVFILVFGIMLAKLIGKLVQGAAADIGIDFSSFIGNLVTNVMIVIIFVLALAQLQIQSSMLEITFAALLGAFALAIAISLGVGSVSISKNIISGVYARKIFKIGQKVKYEDDEGEIVLIGNINSKIKSKKGFVNIPNQILVEQITRVNE